MTQQSNSLTNTSTSEKHLINTYVSDMVALLQHINAPVDSQIKSGDHQSYSEAITTLEKIKSVTASQMQRFDAHLKTLGGSADHGVKSAWASLLGVGASAVNQVRSTKVSKSLRDDSTALSLAAISYTMLHATAVGIGDRTTALLAKQGLDEIAPLIVTISRIMPTVVLQELRDDGENVTISAADFSRETTQQSWGNTAPN